MSTTSSHGSPPRMRRERSFAYNDKLLDHSPYNKSRRNYNGGGYTPTLIAKSPKREKSFYRASNFRDSSPGNREYSGASNRSNATMSIRTNNSMHSGGSGIVREGSIIRSTLSITNGIPDVPLLESPCITTSAGSFRLDYNEQNKLSYRRICKPDPPIQFIRNRERSFVNDAIVTHSQRTKYKDTLLPPYDSKIDIHSQSYIKRPDVQRLLSETYSVKPGERDIKRKYLTQEYLDSLY